MAIIDVHNLQKEKTSQIELKEEVFQAEIKSHVLHQVVVAQLNSKRAGTSSAKNRSQIKGSRAKLWRQKGTGRARVGDAKSPTRVGGGVAFGPVPRKYQNKVSKKVRKAALCMALSDKLKNEQLVVLNEFNMSEIKTREFVKLINNFEVGKTLIIVEADNENLKKSSKNVPWAKVMEYQGLNVLDILNCDNLFLLESAVGKIEEALVS